MMMSFPMSTLSLSLLLLFVVLLEPCTSFSTNPTSLRLPKQQQTPSQLFLFNFPSGGGGANAPTSTANRDSAAINAIKSALQKPRNPKCPLVECEFPALAALNKLGDGSLRSATEAEDANIAFASKLCSKVGSPFGPKVNLVVSSSASRSFMDKVQKKVKGASICSVKDLASTSVSGTTSVFLTPSSKADYQEARKLAEGGCPTVIVNALFKDQKSVPESATMAYFLKPLTYNSQVAGFLVRSYPSQWTVLDAQSSVLGTFSDAEILVPKTNTPDLRASVRLVQKSADEKAIRARSMQ